MIRAVVLAVLLAAAPAMAALPPAVAAGDPALHRFSEAPFHKYFFHVYDASLWIRGTAWSAAQPYALEIHYAMRVSGRDLARKSAEQIARQGVDAARIARWEAEMARIFPDIRPGDRLVGWALPGRETRFYFGERLAGIVADAEFTDAFFAIWLGERTSEPALRASLLRLP